MACDLYNSGVAAALATGKHGEIELETETRILPFGAVDIAVEKSTLHWGGYA